MTFTYDKFLKPLNPGEKNIIIYDDNGKIIHTVNAYSIINIFVNNNLDEGPIITQKIVPVDHSFTVESMISAGHDVERQTLIDALKLVFDDRVFVEGNKTVVFA